MKLIVGLGNPGAEYNHTRHNIGFDVLDNYAAKNKLTFEKKKFGGLYTEINYQDEKIILLKPQKYINLSGEVIRNFVHYFKINIDDILIIHDDLDMDVGKIKLKPSGHSGGHNGLNNIENNLSTINYKRLKIGIANNKTMDTKDYVLGKFSKDDRAVIDESVDIAANIIDDYLKISFDMLMNKYN